MTEDVAINVHCRHCSHPVTLVIAAKAGPTRAVDHWQCPSCHHGNTPRVPGRITAVLEGHEQPARFGAH